MTLSSSVSPNPKISGAVYENQLDIVALLLEAGADPNIKDRFGNTAYDLV